MEPRKTCDNCHGEKFIDDDNHPDGFVYCPTCKGQGYFSEKVSNQELDELTVKLATVMFESGFDVKHNESLNYLRGQIVDMFTEWLGYSVDKNACIRHVIWQDLRDKLGIKNPFK